jgi:hypothetical protein
MQKEQLTLPSKRSRKPLPRLLVVSVVDLHDPPTSCCRFFAFSSSVSELSFSMARMEETRSPEIGGAGTSAETWLILSTDWEQSEHSQSRIVVGRRGKHGTCHGVTHVLQTRVSVSRGFRLQTMQIPSESQGSCAIWDFGVILVFFFSSLSLVFFIFIFFVMS